MPGRDKNYGMISFTKDYLLPGNNAASVKNINNKFKTPFYDQRI